MARNLIFRPPVRQISHATVGFNAPRSTFHELLYIRTTGHRMTSARRLPVAVQAQLQLSPYLTCRWDIETVPDMQLGISITRSVHIFISADPARIMGHPVPDM